MRRNRVILFGCMAASAVLVSFYGGTVTYALFYTMLIIPVLLWVYLLFVYKRFRIYQKIDSRVMVKMEQTPYYFHLTNEDFLTFTGVQVTFLEDRSKVEKLSSNLSYCLLPGEGIERHTTMRAYYRGEYEVGIHQVIVTDFLDIFQLKYRCPSTIKVYVQPRILSPKQLVIVPEEDDQKRQNILIAPNPQIPDTEVRNYMSGDTARMIHWKASARQQNLMTRKFTEEIKSEIVYLLDLKRPEGDELSVCIIEDKIIETALAVTNYFYRKNTKVSVLWQQEEIRKLIITGKAQFDEWYQFCAKASFYSTDGVDKLLHKSTSMVSSKARFIITTACVTKELAKACYEALAVELDVTLVYIGEESAASIRNKLDERIHFFQIRLSDEVLSILEGR